MCVVNQTRGGELNSNEINIETGFEVGENHNYLFIDDFFSFTNESPIIKTNILKVLTKELPTGNFLL